MMTQFNTGSGTISFGARNYSFSRLFYSLFFVDLVSLENQSMSFLSHVRDKCNKLHMH